MKAIALRASIALSATVFGLVLGGCPDGTTGPTNEPLLSMVNESNQNVLLSDGSSSVSFTLRAFTDQGSADNTPIEVTVTDGVDSQDTDGQLASTQGTLDADGRRLTLTPTDGVATFTYQCSPFFDGSVTITADNNVADPATTTITCSAPEGTVTAQIDTSACLGATELQASPGASCLVQGTVSLSVAGSTVPQAGAQVRIRLESLRDVILPDGTTSDDPENDGRRDILSVNGDRNNRAQVINLTTGSNDDNLGEFYFFVHATELTNLRQTMIFTVSGTAQAGTLDIEESTFTVSINEFDNQSSLDVRPERENVIGGTQVEIFVEVNGVSGDPLPMGEVLVEVSGQGATIAADATGDGGMPGNVTSTTISVVNGAASFLVNAPDLEENDPARVVTATAYYTPFDGGNAISASAAFTVNPEGQLLINIQATPDEIRSDENETTIVQVTLEKNGATRDFPVVFEVSEQDTERVGFGERLDDVPPGSNTLPTEDLDQATVDGISLVTVSSQNNRVRGQATIIATVVDNEESPAATYQVEVVIDVDRAPILQSVVFQTAAPEVIGVLGGSKPSSSEVSFKVLDDLNQPMENVSVNFSVPASADPDASVVANDLTGADGLASTVLSAGTRASSIVVIASATFQGVTVSVPSDPIAITGGLVNWGTSYLLCTEAEAVQSGAFTASCQMTLADRFTNAAPPVAVQYRSEGGNITPNVVGSASATFSVGEPGPASASMYAWSYAAANPLSADDLSDPAAYAGCFDNTSSTGCNVLQLCAEDAGNDAVFCPLPIFDRVDANGAPVASACWNEIPPRVLALLGIETGGCTITDNGTTTTVTCPGESPISYSSGGPTQVDYAQSPALQALVEQYKDHLHDCGYKFTCLSDNPTGLSFIGSDDCGVPAGCFDWVGPGIFGDGTLGGGTPCPADSLLTITASVRGEEGFVDENGNGIFDYTDTNGNGRHDRGEPSEAFVDLPETFLDKNDNCFFDELDGSLRLEADEEFRESDQFSDEDNSGDFGYMPAGNPGGPRSRTNGVWDRDKELFFSARLVGLNTVSPIVVRGEACPNPGGDHTCSDGVTVAPCYEFSNPLTSGGYGMATGCFVNRLVSSELISQVPGVYGGDVSSMTFDFAFVDGNGACWDDGNDGTYSITPDGALDTGDVEGAVHNLCGSTPTKQGRGFQNPRRPFCEEFGTQGADYASTLVAIDCAQQTDDATAFSYIEILHSGTGLPISIPVETVCPVCGDGYVTGNEACDPQGPSVAPLVCDDTCNVVDPSAGG